MHNISSVLERGLCSGCGTCAGICKQEALEMGIDRNTGFYRPRFKGENCNDCGICLKLCPFRDDIAPQKNGIFGNIFEIFSGWAKDENIRYNAASGGVATALSIEFFEKGYTVCGTGFKKGNALQTDSYAASSKDQILDMKSSKYMPSEYSKIVRHITSRLHGKLLIIGLPCQIAGIRDIIGYSRPNIILIDLFCGKTMSYKLIRKYAEALNIKKPERINFRDKSTGWNNFSILVQDSCNKDVSKFRENLFGRFWVENLFAQHACINCTYQSSGKADITLGDYWNCKKFADEMAGVSQIVTRTELGSKIVREAKSIAVNVESIDDLPVSQPQFVHRYSSRDADSLIRLNKKILAESDKYDLYQLEKKYIKKQMISTLFHKFKRKLNF